MHLCLNTKKLVFFFISDLNYVTLLFIYLNAQVFNFGKNEIYRRCI